MPYEFKLPPLGEKIESGDVVGVKVAVGDKVSKDQPAFELETDKAVIEVPIPVEGVVKEIRLKIGDKAKVGQVVMVLEEGALSGAAAEKPVEPAQPEAPKAKPDAAPAAKKTEEPVKKTEAAPKKEEPAAPSREQTQPAKEAAVTKKAESKPESSQGEVLAAPSVRAMAREMGLDLAHVRGSGPHGRITSEDVKSFINKSLNQAHGAGEGEALPALPAEGVTLTPVITMPDFSRWGAIEIKPLSAVRRATVKSMTRSWTQIPMVTQFESADITDILELRKKFSKRVEQAGGKLTVTAIILKVVGAALKVFPQFNATLDAANESIIYKKFIHVGVAVDTERGLLVPVIRDVDQKNIVELSVDLNALAEKARQKKITPDELDGATFTITNLGSIATTHFTPIINWPQVAILGVGRSEVKPVWQEEKWIPRTILPLSLTYDHRVIDGADAGRFLKWVSEALSELFLLDLEG